MAAKRNIFQKTASRLGVYYGIISESLHFCCIQLKYNASSATYSDKRKFSFSLSRQAHTLEKGKSVRSPKEGYGVQKAVRLETEIAEYIRRYGEDETVSRCRKILEAWKKDQDSLVVPLDAAQCQAEAKGNFEQLVSSRHSIRVFDSSPVDHAKVEKAMKIASGTPSACNRQAWHTDIFEGEMAESLVRWQGGSRGFESEIKMAILVSCDLRGFLDYEVNQAWVDGGLYAMNLINALHYQGLGTIPLSCGFKKSKIKALTQFGLEDGFVPILIVGVGNMVDCNVAKSVRKTVGETNVWH